VPCHHHAVAIFPISLTDAPDVGHARERPRVLNLLVNPESSVTVLLGPTGSGKSVAAKQAADARAVRLVWIRLAPAFGRVSDLVGLARRTIAAHAETGEDLSSQSASTPGDGHEGDAAAGVLAL